MKHVLYFLLEQHISYLMYADHWIHESFSLSLSVRNMNSGKWNEKTVNFDTEMFF